MKIEDLLISELKKIGIDVTDDNLLQLNTFYKYLSEINKTTNLTRIVEKEEVFLKHFYDSLTLTLVHDFKNPTTVCDIGSGAGFPGIVLKIFFPDIDIVLVESSGKKTKFLLEVIDLLKLKKIKVFNERAEEHVLKNRSTYDIVTARAVAKLPILLELGIPLLKVDGHFIAMKGSKNELEDSSSALDKLNSNLVLEKKITLPKLNDKRILLKIKKQKEIDDKYPREFSKIKKKAL